MAEKVKPNPNEATTHNAQLAAEQIVRGEEKAPRVDFEADYAAAQEFTVSDIDRTPEGEAAATAATAPQYEVPTPEETTTETQPTGNPDDYLNMVEDIQASRDDAVTNVTDDLVQQALQKGQPTGR